MTGTGPVTLATSVRSLSHLLPGFRPNYLVRSCFVVHAHGLLGRELILFLALLEWLVHGPRLAKRLGGTQSPFVRCVLDGLYSSGSCSPPITSRLLPHYSCKPSYSPIGHLVSVWTDLALFITIHRLQITGVPFKSREHTCDRGIKH